MSIQTLAKKLSKETVRITLADMTAYDGFYSTELVRRLEMVVERHVHGLVVMQFWVDARMYHIGEAIQLLPDGVDAQPIQKVFDNLIEEMQNKLGVSHAV